jgi:hypothetical protein
VAKAASRGLRIVSTFGVWLTTNADMTESQQEEWTHARGLLMSSLSETLAEMPRTSEVNLPRMADFGHFARAAETALSLPAGEFK